MTLSSVEMHKLEAIKENVRGDRLRLEAMDFLLTSIGILQEQYRELQKEYYTKETELVKMRNLVSSLKLELSELKVSKDAGKLSIGEHFICGTCQAKYSSSDEADNCPHNLIELAKR